MRCGWLTMTRGKSWAIFACVNETCAGPLVHDDLLRKIALRYSGFPWESWQIDFIAEENTQ